MMIKFDTIVTIEETTTMMEVYTSDCCGEYMTIEEADHGLCPRCHEHCETITETIPA